MGALPTREQPSIGLLIESESGFDSAHRRGRQLIGQQGTVLSLMPVEPDNPTGFAFVLDGLNVPLEVQVGQVRSPQWSMPFYLYRHRHLGQEPRLSRRCPGIPCLFKKPFGHVEECCQQPVVVEKLESAPTF